jgi:hypothetical protein
MPRAILVLIAFATLVIVKPAHAQVACATLPSLEACIQCGAAKYGYEKQAAYCRNHWKPGRKAESFKAYRKKHPECGPSGCPIK